MFGKGKTSDGSGTATKRKRYWSVMLVGEHGRVIPFKHFKGLVIAVAVALLLSQLAAVVLGIAYFQKHRAAQEFEGELTDLRRQIGTLRNEKDILLAKLVIEQGPEAAADVHADVAEETSAAEGEEEAETTAAEGEDQAETNVAAKAEAAPEPSPSPAPEPSPSPQPTPRVRWQADVRRFEVNYTPGAQVLEAVFRIYNVSQPRQMLSGDIVLVYRKKDDPTVPPLAVPNVTLRGGRPNPGGGQEFRINNYRTMRFRAPGQSAPITYDTVTVYVFEEEGTLLLNRDYDVDIPYDPPAPPPPEPAPDPEPSAEAVPPASPGPAGNDDDQAPAGEMPTPSGAELDNAAVEGTQQPETQQVEATMEGDGSENGAEAVFDH
ncbi:hypothetical protein [Desulfatitalea alkaliphila]|uniref:Uncharacterized protein n=1 Tax=Desulfatitalea alkaliphila TaxID=2929485 RepID=A0AA41R1X6_9BACT|nr:hypothetical protein [Desulfatitalea alkaliphila]MCJ8500529.1 hypothetical protein [Desulfatitalea alkaliphila]